MRRVFCVLIILIVGLPTIAMAQTYRCTLDGETRAACCCPGDDDAAEHTASTASTASIDAPCCCEVLRGHAPRTADAVAARAEVPQLPAPALVPATVVAATPSLPEARVSSEAWPRPPPPARVFVTHCALLL